MDRAGIWCSWCNLEQSAHNADLTCGINTKGYGHKWFPGPYEINKDKQIASLNAALDIAEKALDKIADPNSGTQVFERLHRLAHKALAEIAKIRGKV